MNWNDLEENFLPAEGEFSMQLPEGTYSLRVERGKEFEPIAASIPVPRKGKVEETYHLKRWVEMAHTSPIYFWDRNRGIPFSPPDARYLLGRIDSLIQEKQAGPAADDSDSTANVFENEEIRRRMLGDLEQARENFASGSQR
jgi:hypothetical protein